MVFFAEFLSAFAQKDIASDSDSLGVGLSLGLSLVFMIIFGAAVGAIALPQLALCASLWKKNVGKARIYGIVTTIFGGVSVVSTAACFVVAILLNNS